VAEICARLEGIPLAIELAAARVGLSVQEIANRLDDSLKLLTAGNRTAVPRQRTLSGALDWSHDLLSEPERALFRRLSAFAGGWTLQAAEAIGSGTSIEEYEVLDLLSQLVDKSLVLANTTEDGNVRYRLLEPVRQHAREKLRISGESKTVQLRHACWFLELVEKALGDFTVPSKHPGSG
jgi:predicted ATPase